MFYNIIRSAQTKCLDGQLMIFERIINTLYLFDPELLHITNYPLNTFDSEIPLRSATVDASASISKAAIVAFTKL